MTDNKHYLVASLLFCLAMITQGRTELKNIDNLQLTNGQSRTVDFSLTKKKPVLLWIQARIDRKRAETPGGYALKLQLDGKSLTPATVRVLNKREVTEEALTDTEKPEKIIRTFPLFDEKTVTWFLKADSDWRPYNAGLEGGQHPRKELAGYADTMPSALRSHHYEYLMMLPYLTPSKHSLVLEARIPATCKAKSITIKALRISQPDQPFLLSSRDWMEICFPWQAPSVESLLKKPLTLRACAGEYEPVTFSVFVLENLPRLNVKLTDFRLESAKQRGAELPKEMVDVFAVTTRKWENKFRGIPCVPDKEKDFSPELYVPLKEKMPDLMAFRSQRFYLDFHIPDNAKPGIYAGKAQLFSADKLLANVPVKLEVLPFKLVKAKAKYWMWRMHWGDIREPGNIACLKQIKAHGYDGLVRMCGAGLKISIDKTGKVSVDDSGYANFAKTLRETGLSMRISDDGLAANALRTAARHLDIKMADINQNLGKLRKYVENQVMQEEAKKNQNDANVADLTEDDGADDLVNDLIDGKSQQEKREAEVEKRYRALKGKLDSLMITISREAKQAAEKHGLQLWVFPVDEPCGTPWRRDFTTYTAGLAKQAGLETFSTRNNFDWNANIDHNAMGGGICAMYTGAMKEIVSKTYTGDLAFPALPMIGSFRGGSHYHFNGLIDDVRIYDRAFTDDEIKNQHKTPVPGDLLLYYSFDDEKDGKKGRVIDLSGNGHDGELINKPVLVQGRTGNAIRLDSARQQRIVPQGGGPQKGSKRIPLDKGWTISMWFKGQGSLFGWGYEFYHSSPGLIFTTTTTPRAFFPFNSMGTRLGWSHVTFSFDPQTKTVKGFLENSEVKKWYRDNVRWNYMQIRSGEPNWCRYKTGIMGWYYANCGALKNITTFGYDLNDHTYVAYPKNGDRWNKEGIWYRTPGLEGAREGIDDARYLQTLVEVIKAKKGISEKQAVNEVRKLIAPLTVSYADQKKVYSSFGGYRQLRDRLINEILKLTKKR